MVQRHRHELNMQVAQTTVVFLRSTIQDYALSVRVTMALISLSGKDKTGVEPVNICSAGKRVTVLPLVQDPTEGIEPPRADLQDRCHKPTAASPDHATIRIRTEKIHENQKLSKLPPYQLRLWWQNQTNTDTLTVW